MWARSAAEDQPDMAELKKELKVVYRTLAEDKDATQTADSSDSDSDSDSSSSSDSDSDTDHTVHQKKRTSIHKAIKTEKTASADVVTPAASEALLEILGSVCGKLDNISLSLDRIARVYEKEQKDRQKAEELKQAKGAAAYVYSLCFRVDES